MISFKKWLAAFMAVGVFAAVASADDPQGNGSSGLTPPPAAEPPISTPGDATLQSGDSESQNELPAPSLGYDIVAISVIVVLIVLIVGGAVVFIAGPDRVKDFFKRPPRKSAEPPVKPPVGPENTVESPPVPERAAPDLQPPRTPSIPLTVSSAPPAAALSAATLRAELDRSETAITKKLGAMLANGFNDNLAEIQERIADSVVAKMKSEGEQAVQELMQKLTQTEEKARADLEAKQNELDRATEKAETDLEAKQAELDQAETKAAADLAQKDKDLEKYRAELEERDGFYGEESEKLRCALLKEVAASRSEDSDQPVQVPEKEKAAVRMLMAAWLRLTSTKEVSLDELTGALSAFDTTLWNLFGKGNEKDEEKLRKLETIRGYFVAPIDLLLSGTIYEFEWPVSGLSFDQLKDEEFRIENGYRSVRYATCGLIRKDGKVVTRSRVFGYDD